ncbi:MAG: DUF1192 domain-containing protein [Pseudomonadota bacterium]
MDENDEISKQPDYEIGQDLSQLSVEELDETIGLLKEEITRLTEARDSKSAHLNAAEALFKS